MCDTKARFARHRLRCTKQRVELFQTLASTACHPTADELHQLAQQRGSQLQGVSIATVYNTLEAFCSHGLCKRIPTTEGAARYDAVLHDHLHLTMHDGRIVDVPEDLSRAMLEHIPAELLEKIGQRMGVKVDCLHIALHAGCCSGDETAGSTGGDDAAA